MFNIHLNFAIASVTSNHGPRTIFSTRTWRCTVMAWWNNSQDSTWTLCDARSDVARAPHGNFQCFHIPCGIHKGAARHPYGHVKELTQPELAKIPHGVVCGRAGPLRYPQGLVTGCLRSPNPYGALKLIKHALKLYGPRTGRQDSYGPARGPYGPHEWS